jgi:hypothetical protein
MRLKPHVRFWSRAGMVTFRLRQRSQGVNASRVESKYEPEESRTRRKETR